jgi:hypothetical protein
MKNKKLIFGIFFFFCAANPVFYAKEIPQALTQKARAEEELVYLPVSATEVSSFDTTADWAPLPEPRATIDGDLLTRWSSNYTDNQWIVFDFSTPKIVSKIALFWEAAYAVNYDVLVSDDGKDWKNLFEMRGRKGKIEQLDLPATKTRFVKIIALKRFNSDWGTSLLEAVFLGPAKDNPQDKAFSLVYPKLAGQLSGKPEAAKQAEKEPVVASPGAITALEFQKGVVYTSWGRQEIASEASDKTLEYLYKLGVRHLGIMIVWLQPTIEEKTISPDPKDTPDDNAIIHAINKAHSLGMKVALKPHVDVKDGAWRGDIIPSAEWFVSYKEFIVRYAKLAAEYNVELYGIGTELGNTTLPNWNTTWEGIIKEIKAVYSGKLVYCANWNEYQDVEFWDKMDFIGIDAYFPITDKKDPTKEEMIDGWKNNALQLDKWLKGKNINKPIVFTEIGYCSADGTNIQPWSTLSNLSEEFIDQQEQADALDAMMAGCSAYPWFKGIYWWNYFPQDRWSPLGYTIRGKKAEEVLTEWFNKL